MNEELYIAFENYLNNEMSPEEQLEFENQLQNDADIQEKFEIYKATNAFLETKFDSKTIDFKKNLESISKAHFSETEKTEQKKETKVIAFKPIFYSVAASLVLFLGAWFFMQNNDPKYGDYNQHENAYFTERGDIDKNLTMAQDAFNAKKYKDAIIYFEMVLKEYDKPEVRYFYGISLLEENKFMYSDAIFKKLKAGTSVYKDKATWYLALSSLKQKKIKDCKMYLQQIPTDAEDYDRAQQLLNNLD